MQTILGGLTLPLPVIEMNGAFLSDLTTGRHVVINDLGPDLANAVFDILWTAGHAPFVSTFDGARDRLYHVGVRNDGMRWYLDERARGGDRRVREVDGLRPRLRERVVCFTVIDRRERLEALRARILESLGERVSVRRFENGYFPAWDWLTIQARAATKDRAIATLIESSGLDGAEIVAFGDGDNDVALFRAADRAVAVANASPDLKALAADVIGPSWEDSVVAYIESDAAGRVESQAGQVRTGR